MRLEDSTPDLRNLRVATDVGGLKERQAGTTYVVKSAIVSKVIPCTLVPFSEPLKTRQSYEPEAPDLSDFEN